MKRILIFFIHVTLCMSLNGQTIVENIVRQFGYNLRDWCSTKDTDYRMRAQMLCTEACRVEDKIMRDFTSTSNLNIRNFVIQSYLNGFEAALDNGSITIEMKEIESISPIEWALDKSTAQKKEKLTEDYAIFKCNIVVNGILNYDINDTYYVSKGLDAKIVKITPFEEIVDQKTGEKKVRVDFSKMEKHVKKTSKAYPIQVSRGIIARKQYIDGNSLIILNEVDTKQTSFESLKGRAEKMKKSFLGMYCLEPVLFRDAALVIDNDMQIIERYVNMQTREVLDLVMTKDELIENIYSIHFKNAKEIRINDIVLQDVSKWKNTIETYLNNYPRMRVDANEFEKSNQIFLLENDLDRKFEYSLSMPVITISLINESNGSTQKVRKSIRDFYPYISNLHIRKVRIEVPKIDVYVVDALDVRRANGMDNSFNNPYYIEHIFAKDSYLLVNDIYKQIKRESIGSCIGRGRSMDKPFRPEYDILKNSKILTIFGDAEINVYYKQ